MRQRFVQCATLMAMLVAAPLSAQALQTVEATPRSRLLMDYGWQFLLGDTVGAEAPSFDDTAWRLLDLPHDWSIEGVVEREAPSGGAGGYFPTGIGWYRRTFRVPAGAANRVVHVEFDGVYEDSDVWINGHHLGHRPFGYIGFAYDLTPHLVDGDNVLAVRVNNANQPNSRWYSGSGIYRHVWLTITDPLHVAQWGTFVTTPHIDSTSARVAVRTRIENAGSARRAVVRLMVIDPAGTEVARTEQRIEVRAAGSVEVDQQLDVPAPQRWSLESPAMYTLRTDIADSDGRVADSDGRVVDRTETPFGIRSIEYHPDRGFLLNGQRVKLLGVNLHHDGGPVGAAVPEAVWARRFRLLEAMGVNAIRTAHNPPAPEFLDLADRMGFVVMNEAFDEWTHGKVRQGYNVHFNEWADRDLADFIRRDRNHPSVVLWSLGNEIGEQHAPGGHDVLRRLREVAKREDPTRPITTGNDHIYADDGATTDEFLDLLDIVGYNYVDRWHERRELYAWQERQRRPDWKHIGTESGPVGGTRGVYSLGNDSTRVRPNYVTAMIRASQLWKFVSLNDWFAGDFMWTGIDYLGEASWPRTGASSGQLDLVGFPDDGYYFYQSRWTTEPMLHLFPHWNWPGREGQTMPVLAYTNVDAVELYLDDRFIGEKRFEFPRQGTTGSWNNYELPQVFPTTADLHLSWDVPYEPGVLRAVGRRAGEIVITKEVRTAGAPAALRLSVDRDTILSGIRDIAHVTIEVVDAAGTVVPIADNLVRVSVEGAADFLTMGNGNHTDHTRYGIPERRTHGGLALAMIRSGDRTGNVRVTARADGIESASIEFTVVHGDAPPRLP